MLVQLISVSKRVPEGRAGCWTLANVSWSFKSPPMLNVGRVRWNVVRFWPIPIPPLSKRVVVNLRHQDYFDGLVQVCGNSISNVLELSQSCTKPLLLWHMPVVIIMIHFIPWLVSRSPFYYWWLTFISTWISNHMPSKVWDETAYPFPNFNGSMVKV